MAMRYSVVTAFVTAIAAAQAQSLLNATARYAQLSNFNDLLSSFPDIAASLITNISTSEQRQTILVPSNEAFSAYRQRNGASISSLSSSDVGNILNYHTLQGALSSSDIQRPSGLISETALRNSTYARRNETDSLPQVVFISSTETAARRKIKARQISALSSVDVRSGEGNEVELEQTPGNWSGGVFYVVNGFLTLPLNQTDTMTAANLTSFVRGLARTNVTQGTIMGFLNTTTNLTTPANDPIYDNTANIPTPPPTSSPTSSGGAIPTSNATGNRLVPSATGTTASQSAGRTGAGPAATGQATGGTSLGARSVSDNTVVLKRRNRMQRPGTGTTRWTPLAVHLGLDDQRTSGRALAVSFDEN
ncbi:MAG: hypothetical protein Q9182_001262 [Xanthomendoza sp. 2 TL-2023]